MNGAPGSDLEEQPKQPSSAMQSWSHMDKNINKPHENKINYSMQTNDPMTEKTK